MLLPAGIAPPSYVARRAVLVRPGLDGHVVDSQGRVHSRALRSSQCRLPNHRTDPLPLPPDSFGAVAQLVEHFHGMKGSGVRFPQLHVPVNRLAATTRGVCTRCAHNFRLPTATNALKRGTVSIQKRKTKDGTTTYLARCPHRTGAIGKTFSKRGLAVSWLAEQAVEHRFGTWVDPNAGKIRFAEWVEKWTPTHGNHLRASSKGNDATLLRARVLPRWRNVALRDISHLEVNRWVGDLCNELAPSSVHKVVSLFNKVLTDARRSAGSISHNPCGGLRLPKIEKKELRIPTAQEVARLADAIDGRYRALVLLAAYTGGCGSAKLRVCATGHAGPPSRTARRFGDHGERTRTGCWFFNSHAKTDAGSSQRPDPKVRVRGTLEAHGAEPG